MQTEEELWGKRSDVTEADDRLEARDRKRNKVTEKMNKAEEMKMERNEEDSGCKGANDLSAMH